MSIKTLISGVLASVFALGLILNAGNAFATDQDEKASIWAEYEDN